MWTKFQVEMRFVSQLCASMPADPEIQRRWLEARKPKNRPPDSKSIQEVHEEVMATTPPDAEPSLHVFQRQEGGLVLRMATVRAHYKDCARIMSSLYIGKIEKEKSFAVKVLNGIYYPPENYWIPVLNHEGKQIKEPTGTRDKPVHAMTPQGRISAIKSFEYCDEAMLRVQLNVLTPPKGRPVVSQVDMEELFEYGGLHGYGGERGDGEGRYIPTVTRLED